ncbi:hypothetical protein ACQKDS_17185 [Serratia sp. NPDC078593]|uniref:hypothetical protein n=1 Tax=unclassified Serratia (in: enterobacteria) TaxID=2647522 RepID=UPI0037D1579B
MSQLAWCWRLIREHWPLLLGLSLIALLFVMVMTIDNQCYELEQAQQQNRQLLAQIQSQEAAIAALQQSWADEISLSRHVQ